MAEPNHLSFFSIEPAAKDELVNLKSYFENEAFRDNLSTTEVVECNNRDMGRRISSLTQKIIDGKSQIKLVQILSPIQGYAGSRPAYLIAVEVEGPASVEGVILKAGEGVYIDRKVTIKPGTKLTILIIFPPHMRIKWTTSSAFDVDSKVKNDIIPGLLPWLEHEAFTETADDKKNVESRHPETKKHLGELLGTLYSGVSEFKLRHIRESTTYQGRPAYHIPLRIRGNPCINDLLLKIGCGVFIEHQRTLRPDVILLDILPPRMRIILND